MLKKSHCVGLIGVVPAGALAAARAAAQDKMSTAQEAHRDIESTLGIVPSFSKAVPATGIAGAWAELKSVQLNPATELSG